MNKKILIGFILIISLIAIPAINSQEVLDINVEYFGPIQDINHDGIINYLDVSSLVSHYGETGDPGWIRDDIIVDGDVI